MAEDVFAAGISRDSFGTHYKPQAPDDPKTVLAAPQGGSLEPDSKLPIRTFRPRQASHDDESEGDLQPCERRFHRRLEVL